MGIFKPDSPDQQPIKPAPVPFGLIAVLVAFVALATLHSFMVPLTQGEDELAHYRYLSFIAQTGRLPIDHEEREQAWYRSDWPPLYHLLVGWSISPLDTTRPHFKDIGESPHRRLVGQIFYPRLIVYTADVSWPWQDGVLAWHIGRFLSILFATAALGFTYRTALELGRLFPQLPIQAPTFATLSTALLAFTPRFIFTSAMLSDDSLFILLSAIFIWLLLRALRGSDAAKIYVLMGLLLGLSITTKYSTGLLPLAMLPVVWWRVRQSQQTWQWAISRIALGWTATLIGLSWWFGWIAYYFNTIKEDGLIFGLLHPLLASGPDVSMGRIFAFFTGEPFTRQARPDAIEAGTFGEWWVYLFQTFWGVPVLEHDPLFPGAYLLLLLGCLMATAGLVRVWLSAESQTRMALTVLGLIFGLLLPFPILRFFLTYNIYETGQGRHILYPAAQATPILLMLGWLKLVQWGTPNLTALTRLIHLPTNTGVTQTELVEPDFDWLNRRLSKVLRNSCNIYLYGVPPTLLLAGSLFQLTYMARIYPDPLPIHTTTFDPTIITHPLHQPFVDGAIDLIGYDLRPPLTESTLSLTLYWQANRPVNQNYRLQLQAVDEAGRVALTWLTHPLDGRYPTRAWDAGDTIRDTLTIPLDGLFPDIYDLQLNLLPEADSTPLLADPLTLDAPLLFGPRLPPVEWASLGDQLRYRLQINQQPARYRQTIGLTWQSRPPESADETVTWSLLGPDHQPRKPIVTGEQQAVFMVAADWPSGAYRLQAQPSGLHTEPVLTIANDIRQFDLPPSLPEPWTPLEANFADQLLLLGYSLPTPRTEAGGRLPLTLYWQSLAPVLDDYVTFGVLLNNDQTAYGSIDRYPQGFYSPILWTLGEVVNDNVIIPIKSDAPAGVYYLHLGQYYLTDGSPKLDYLAIMQYGQPTTQTAIVIGPIKVGQLPDYPFVHHLDDITPQFTDNQILGEKIILLGHDLTISSERQLILTLYWQAQDWLATDYTTFFHVRNRANETVSQKDNPPAQGLYPTSVWGLTEVIADQFTLSLSDLPTGQYTPVVGLYDPTTGQRLTVPGNPDSEISLPSIDLP